MLDERRDRGNLRRPVVSRRTGFADRQPLLTRSLSPFTVLVIISNVTATKGVAFGPIITDGGFIVFPLTYIIGDVLAGHGPAAARRAIILGFLMNGLAALARSGSRCTCRRPLSQRPGKRYRQRRGAWIDRGGLAGFIVGQTIQRLDRGVKIKETHQGEAPVGPPGGLDVRRAARRHPGGSHPASPRTPSASTPSAISPPTPLSAGSTRPPWRWSCPDHLPRDRHVKRRYEPIGRRDGTVLDYGDRALLIECGPTGCGGVSRSRGGAAQRGLRRGDRHCPSRPHRPGDGRRTAAPGGRPSPARGHAGS